LQLNINLKVIAVFTIELAVSIILGYMYYSKKPIRIYTELKNRKEEYPLNIVGLLSLFDQAFIDISLIGRKIKGYKTLDNLGVI